MLEPELWGKSTNFLANLHKQHMSHLEKLITWKDNESIFEFGIGDGTNTKQTLLPILPQDYKEFIGSDISHEMIEFVQSNMSDTRSKFIKLDICSKNIPNELLNRFDHIFSFCVMHWLQNTEQALKNLYEMLKPGGQMILTYVHETSADEVYDLLSHHPRWSEYNHKCFTSPYYKQKNICQVYKALFSKAGFVEKYFEVDSKRSYKFEDKKMFEEFCLSVNPVLKKIPKEDYEDYKAEYIKMMTNNKYNFTTVCSETEDICYNTSFELNLVVLEKV
ncbi:juvenile hormone acid O-methyltransferase-like isoform X1 [Diorhabda sublineata]|uniref:juvenile hormone acid O-methyltransferase-like isoform X1 n=2 Tax=Diorhabda sublineata TaxID=1163346 RepID=UPI0024E14381|nr:juvenile hormone acid O-methyltransferase-like isoform X1 [Diorhabda sublineata]